ncbi:MAG: hypothetical protein KGZ63_14480 [Clostridiales bacterium]|nr:hypothetical protein [Clostridiales bacterium]
MFYLEVVGCDGGEECRSGHLFASYEGVKEALAETEWVRYVITELVVNT